MVEIVIAGVQKCGTTALHKYLCCHPQIVGGHKKEIHYFDDPTVNWSRPDYAIYDAQFPARKPGQMRLDASPSYIYLPHCLDRLRACNPEVRLILLFRDPIERAWSHWAMATRRRRETLGFDAAIRAERRRIAAYPPGDIGYKACAYLDRGFYGRQLSRALDLFPRDRILCLASEMLKANPAAVLAQVSTHLGIAPFGLVQPLELNKGPGRPITMEPGTRAFIQEMLQDDIRLFSRLSGLYTGHWSLFSDPQPAS
ncbi:sulfotransferase [Thiorhodococcus drewsii AZ1]|uniref:Sulfotransferase n=1 Tax=Thiorhodococcus drewsii AZ1 TaxID=765913 RepID=G2E8H7_9GAMM|nr:sulfotransferase [Thiorhodococcus drewsii]EGV27592.1 sulfotransferase [Thiorhodococcus drewsii AZ1]